MKTTTTIGILLVIVLGLAAPARALNAEADVDLGDKIHGSIETAGEFDRLTFEVSRGAELNFSVKALDDDLELSIALFPPDTPATEEPIAAYLSGSTSKVKLKRFPVRVSGAWVLEVRAATATQGRYQAKLKVEYRSSWKSVDPIAASSEAVIPFASPEGGKLKFKVKIDDGDIDPAVDRLETPSGATALPADLKQSDIVLSDLGEYELVVNNLAAVAGALKVKLKVKAPSHDSRKMYLSPRGFDERPSIDSRDPKKGLRDDVVSTVTIEGENFVDGATVRLERKGRDDRDAEDVVVASATRITCSLDLTDLKTGTWDLVVENPGGGTDDTSFTVKKPGSVTLPAGVVDDTEVWYIEFGDQFDSDLGLFGLSSTSDTVAERASETVQAYIIYNLREIFGAKGRKGFLRDGAVPISFVVEKPTALVGEPGETYNRLLIGGEAQPGDPASDNPSVAWGFAPIDTGNANVDDLSRDGGAGRGLHLRALTPNGTNVTPAFQAAFTPLIASPMTTSDAIYFLAGFDPTNAQESARYTRIDLAIRTLAREVAAVAAHHIARAMGLPNGASGVSSTPGTVGTFAGLAFPEFTGNEIDTLEVAARPSNLPGSSKILQANYLPLRGTADYLFPEVNTATTVLFDLPYAGGRPDLQPEDIDHDGAYGVIPTGFLLGNGLVGGLAPYTINFAWYYGAFKFGVRIEDEVSGDVDIRDHRINLVINLALVPAGQQNQAQSINASVRAVP